MGRVSYCLRLLSAVMMAAAFVVGAVAFSDALDNLGRPDGQPMLGAMFLAASACFMTAFLSAGILWVLTELLEQVELSRQPNSGRSDPTRTESQLSPMASSSAPSVLP